MRDQEGTLTPGQSHPALAMHLAGAPRPHLAPRIGASAPTVSSNAEPLDEEPFPSPRADSGSASLLLIPYRAQQPGPAGSHPERGHPRLAS